MKEISYGNDRIVTANAVADALLEYARALGAAVSADTVEIPVILGDGSISSMQILIGPASQLTTQPVESASPEPDGSAVVAELEERTGRLRRSVIIPEQQSEPPLIDPSDEYGLD